MNKSLMAVIAIVSIAFLGAAGCATKASVQQETVAVQEQIEPEPVELSTIEEVDVEPQDPCSTLENAMARAEQLTNDTYLGATEYDGNIQFEFDKYALSAEAKATIDAVVAPLVQANKDIFIELQGHTDDFGSDEYNFQLGLARARAAMGYLYSQHGISLQSMNCFSCGESRPIAQNDGPKGRAENRRVTIVVIE